MLNVNNKNKSIIQRIFWRIQRSFNWVLNAIQQE